MFQSRTTLFVCFLAFLCIQLSDAVPVQSDKSDYLMDSPRHLIKTLNYKAAAKDLSAAAVASPAQARTAKSDEDGQLMYVVIKPSPPVKKYRPDNKEIYMDGVVGASSSSNDRRMPRLNLASGAYPVFYSIASANGKFGRNIRALTKEEISQANRLHS